MNPPLPTQRACSSTCLHSHIITGILAITGIALFTLGILQLSGIKISALQPVYRKLHTPWIPAGIGAGFLALSMIPYCIRFVHHRSCGQPPQA